MEINTTQWKHEDYRNIEVLLYLAKFASELEDVERAKLILEVAKNVE